MGQFSIDSSRFDRPNRITTPEKEKDTPEYHVRNAKFAIATNAINSRSSFIKKTKINKQFFKGGDNQWLFDEDTEAFLKDDTGQDRSRIKAVNNVVRPIVSQYQGNANRLQLSARSQAVSERAKNRMTEALKKKLFMFDVSLESPAYSDYIKKKHGLGDTPEETESIFMNSYTDEYVEKMNHLIIYIEKINRLDQYKIKLAENLALSGLAVMYGYEANGHLKFKPVESEDFIFDNTAERYDLTDSEFMGIVDNSTPTGIYERYNVSEKDAASIENYVNNIGAIRNQTTLDDNVYSAYGRNNLSGLQVPVYKIYFKDVQREEYGYVIDEYGYTHLEKLNYAYPGEDEPRYTKEDVVTPPNSARNRFLFKGKETAFCYNEVLRYCHFIPSEFIAAGEPSEDKKRLVTDIVLEWGVDEYQDSTLENPSEVKFPFKVHTWGYVDGEIVSPVDDVISPQRLINRILSVTEANINNSGGANTVIDEDSLNPEDVKDGTIARDIKQGKPIFVRTRGKGVPNSIGHYDNTPSDGIYKMFEVIPLMRDIIQSTTGVNEPLQGGEQKGSGTQLVGVTELLIQRGSLIQEPFYKALEEIYLQMYESMMTRGKKIYIDNERVLSNAIGDDGVYTFKLSKDMLNEDLRVFIKRENNEEMLKSQANQDLLTFMEMGIIDKKTFAQLYNRSTPDDVVKGLRQQASAEIEMAREEAKMQEQALEQQAIEEDADLALAKEEELEKEQRDLETFAKQEAIKAEGKEKEQITQAVLNERAE
jgi:hypothetical protein